MSMQMPEEHRYPPAQPPTRSEAYEALDRLIVAGKYASAPGAEDVLVETIEDRERLRQEVNLLRAQLEATQTQKSEE